VTRATGSQRLAEQFTRLLDEHAGCERSSGS
jgi:hypothetical protein